MSYGKRLAIDGFEETLDWWGELHVQIDGTEFHLHKHDVDVEDNNVLIDSKDGDWEFTIDDIEHVEYPHSHKE